MMPVVAPIMNRKDVKFIAKDTPKIIPANMMYDA